MNFSIKNSASALLSASAVLCIALAPTASAFQFGGYPTKTVQEERKARSIKAAKNAPKHRSVVVDAGGPGFESGQMPTYRTINDALKNVVDGGTIVVMPGEYRENIKLERGVRLEGNTSTGGRVEVIQADASKPCLSMGNKNRKNFNSHVSVSNIFFSATRKSSSDQSGNSSSQLSIYNDLASEPCIKVTHGVFTMTNSTVLAPKGGYSGDLIAVEGGTAVLEGNIFDGGTRGVYVHGGHSSWDRTLIVGNEVRNNATAGIHLKNNASVLATGNTIYNNGHGLIHNGNGKATLVGNKILKNDVHGISLGNDAREVVIRLNQIYKNGEHGIRVHGSHGLIADNDINNNAKFEISTENSISVPVVLNDVGVNKPSKRRGSWGFPANVERHNQ